MSSEGHQQPRHESVDEQVRHDRLADIRDARRRLRDARQNAQLMRLEGRASPADAVLYHHSALRGWLIELLPFAERNDETQRYWTGDDGLIGQVVAQPPDRDADVWTPRKDLDDVSPPEYDRLEPVVVDEWYGLADVLDAPEKYHPTWYYSGYKNALRRTFEAQVEVYPSLRLLEQATMYSYKFAKVVGLELNLDPDERDVDPNPI